MSEEHLNSNSDIGGNKQQDTAAPTSSQKQSSRPGPPMPPLTFRPHPHGPMFVSMPHKNERLDGAPPQGLHPFYHNNRGPHPAFMLTMGMHPHHGQSRARHVMAMPPLKNEKLPSTGKSQPKTKGTKRKVMNDLDQTSEKQKKAPVVKWTEEEVSYFCLYTNFYVYYGETLKNSFSTVLHYYLIRTKFYVKQLMNMVITMDVKIGSVYVPMYPAEPMCNVKTDGKRFLSQQQ